MNQPRGALNAERIVSAAVEIIERDGADALSMRRVASELGVATMSLYNHVENKAALLDAAADWILRDMRFAADPDSDWRDQARQLARTFRDIARRYPRSVSVVITRQPRSITGLHTVELVLAALRKAGFEGITAVRVLRTFEAFILGSLVREAGVADQPPPKLEWFAGELEEAGLVNTRAFLPELVLRDSEGDFEFGLELLISAVGALPRGEEAEHER
ncbi:MAG TPA: TetR/AcrR family transcriptional regulator C-terminal domain-containing protein [Pseudonocardia sp.]|nr:TetR/AcrR family transcriptional regulator C-terminal domain-containing protein [Pseudonocardia sp.]